MPILPSQFRHKVKIQERSTITDEYGQQSTVWSDVKSVWAGVDPLPAEETSQAGAVNFIASHRVYMRYTKGVTHQMRIVLKGSKILRIISIANDQEINHMLTLLCKEVVQDEQ